MAALGIQKFESLATFIPVIIYVSQNFSANYKYFRGQHTKIATVINQVHSRRELYSSQRKNSLPPLNQNQTLLKDKQEGGSETSGYASDNPIQPGYIPPSHFQGQSGYESASSRDDRPRWKDKVMSSDWEQKESNVSSTRTNEPPNWLKRGLEQGGQIEVTNSSPSESPEQDYIDQDRPFTGSSSTKSRSVCNIIYDYLGSMMDSKMKKSDQGCRIFILNFFHRTYIRGQNIRLDLVELAERERKREIALQHQQAIRNQLEERERKRSAERRRRIKEEYEEELRIAKEQELERRRHEYEQKILQEKHEKEEKRKAAMREAIELAEKEAKLQKMKLKLLKQQKNNINLKNEHLLVETPTKECDRNIGNNVVTEKEKSNLTPRNFSVSQKDENRDNLNNTQPSKIENRTTEISIKNNLESEHYSKDAHNNLNENMKVFPKTVQNQENENVTIVIPSNFEALQHFKYAVLMSIPSSAAVPIAIPVASENAVTSTRTENRILTPTQYRQKNKLMCDSSTQTEDSRIDKYHRDKNTNIDSVYESRSRKGRTSSRNENFSDRPKWGVNRPPTRYLKQSEKDLVYQRKKLRQKNEENLYDDKNSSDESQMGTPRYRKRSHMDKRHPRSLWRKHASEEVFRRDVRMYQSEIIPIEADKNNVCFEHRCCCKCRCTGNHDPDSRVDILTVNHNSPRSSQQISMGVNSNDNQIQIVETLPLLQNETNVNEY